MRRPRSPPTGRGDGSPESAPEIFTASSQSSECVPSTGFQWNLTKRDSPFALTKPERVHAEALHHPVASRDRAIRHHPHDHVRGLGHQRDEVPERVVRRSPPAACAWCGSGFTGMDQVRKLHRVLDEEHRDVVADEVPVALVGVELHGEAAHVARRVGRTALARRPSRSARTPVSACRASAKIDARVSSVSGL